MVSSNPLIMGTGQYEDVDTIHRVTNGEFQLYSSGFERYFSEMMQNYKKVAGYLYSEADLAKIREEERPDFVYPLMLPIVLALAGNFLGNQNKVIINPRTVGDFQMSKIMESLVDYVHYTANDFDWEYAIAYINSIIGRVGWIRQEWMYDKDPEGMLDISSWNPLGVMWDTGGANQTSFNSCKLIYLNSWYTPEELKSNFAYDNTDLWDEITEKVKLVMGEYKGGKNKIPNYYERLSGNNWGYRGEDQGYDEISILDANSRLFHNANYWDSINGLFKVSEVHEKRQEKILTIYDPVEDKKWDITKFVKADKDRPDKTYDPFKMDYVRNYFNRGGEIIVEPKVECETVLYQVDVCPTLNLKLYDAPYEVQNNNFKLTPIFCMNFGQDSMEWKSYIDHITDAVKGFNLRMNTLQTILLKSAHSETWAEEDAIVDEEDFLSNKIGGLKYVTDLDKVEQKQPAPLSPGLMQMMGVEKDLIKEITGVRDNALGTQESDNESGVLFAQRVRQTDQMQALPQTNALRALKPIGENTRDYLIQYLGYDRAFRITMDETNPYWIELNQDAIKKMFVDKEGHVISEEIVEGDIFAGKYDVEVSDAPLGFSEQQQQFQELITLTNLAMKARPEYVNIPLVIKSSNLKNKDEWLEYIKEVDAQAMQQAQMQQQQAQGQMDNAMLQEKLKMIEQLGKMKNDQMDLKDKAKELKIEDAMGQAFMKAIAS